MMSDQRASLFAAHSAAEGLKARAAADEATRQLSRGSATPWISMLAKDYKEHLLAPPTGLHWPIGSRPCPPEPSLPYPSPRSPCPIVPVKSSA